MEITPFAYQNAALALNGSVQEHEKQEMAKDAAILNPEDLVEISPAAREKLQEAESMDEQNKNPQDMNQQNADRQDEEQANPQNAVDISSGFTDKTASGKAAAPAAQLKQTEQEGSGEINFASAGAGAPAASPDKRAERVAELQQKLKEIQQQLTRAKSEAAQAQASARNDAAAQEAAGQAGSTDDADSAQREVTRLETQMMQINQELQQLMGNGASSVAAPAGTSAEGGAGRMSGHIGRANDPYAAAAAYEAAELAGEL